MHEPILIENISFSRNCDIKTTNAKNVTDASIWAKFISKNSKRLEIEHSLLNIRLYILYRISCHLISQDSESICKQIANTVLFCDRAFLRNKL